MIGLMSRLVCQRFVQSGQDFSAAHQSDDDVQIRAVHDTGIGDADRHVDELAFDLEALLDFLEQGLYRVAVTGVMHGPDLNVIVALMGRDKVLQRLDKICG